MALLDQPVMVTTCDGRRFRATAMHVDFQTERVFVRFGEPFENCSGWIDIERIEYVDGFAPDMQMAAG